MIRLQSDGAVLEIDPVRGGRLASLRIDGRELLVTPPDAENRSIFWGSFPMAPWAGRIDGAALDWEGAHYDLPPEAAATLETEELIPTGRRVAVDDITDLRDGPVLGTRLLDHVYPDPVPPAIVEWPDLELQIGFAAPITTLVVHSRPTAFCVEPQTAWPNAPALAAAGVPGTGLKVLRPGECLHAEMTWSWRATARRG